MPVRAARPLGLRDLGRVHVRRRDGYFRCPDCRRFYFIADGIPRFLTEEFAELIDAELPERVPEAFEADRNGIDAFLSLLDADRPKTGASAWGVEDVAFWETEYAKRSKQEAMQDQVARSRPDAGNRTYPRERMIFSRLRPRLEGGGTLLDMGCGYSQTVRAVCHPSEVGYLYVGCDLALSPLQLSRRTFPGEFVQCSVEKPPFRSGSADALILLGTLHHLSDPERALGLCLDAVRPGGAIAIHEVIGRSGVGKRLGVVADDESAHNESIDWPRIRERMAREVTAGTVRFGYSPVRDVLARGLGERMRSSPWLTQLVLALDTLCIKTLGRVSSFFGPREVLVFAEKTSAAAPPSSGSSPLRGRYVWHVRHLRNRGACRRAADRGDERVASPIAALTAREHAASRARTAVSLRRSVTGDSASSTRRREGAQPMSYADGRYWITYNGELYNFRELRAELVSDGYSFDSDCDTEVMLAMYARHGREMVRRLNGIFAFAIWDAERQELFMARDRLGVKPLYYYPGR